MTVFVFGNPDLKEDALPFRLLPQLRRQFPNIRFEVRDPNEEWDVPTEFIAIDTVVGLTQVRVFDDLDAFANAPRLTLHDYDIGTHLKLLRKLGKLKTIEIIGLPPTLPETEALEAVSAILRASRP